MNLEDVLGMVGGVVGGILIWWSLKNVGKG